MFARTMLGEEVFDVFLCAGVRQVSDEDATRLGHVFLFLVGLQDPGEALRRLLLPLLLLPGAVVGHVHTEHFDVASTWNHMSMLPT